MFKFLILANGPIIVANRYIFYCLFSVGSIIVIGRFWSFFNGLIVIFSKNVRYFMIWLLIRILCSNSIRFSWRRHNLWYPSFAYKYFILLILIYILILKNYLRLSIFSLLLLLSLWGWRNIVIKNLGLLVCIWNSWFYLFGLLIVRSYRICSENIRMLVVLMLHRRTRGDRILWVYHKNICLISSLVRSDFLRLRRIIICLLTNYVSWLWLIHLRVKIVVFIFKMTF